jgi:hypothetical protein
MVTIQRHNDDIQKHSKLWNIKHTQTYKWKKCIVLGHLNKKTKPVQSASRIFFMVLASPLEDSNADVVLFCVRYNYERNSIQGYKNTANCVEKRNNFQFVGLSYLYQGDPSQRKDYYGRITRSDRTPWMLFLS